MRSNDLKNIIQIFLTAFLFLTPLIYSLDIFSFDSQGWSNDRVLTSKLTIGNYIISSNKNFYTNYGYNFNVNQNSLYYVFQNPSTDKITIATKDNSLVKFVNVNAYQVSESSTRSLIIEGWNGSSKLYTKTFSKVDSWQTLNLNFDKINKVIIRISTSSTNELTDYNFDNFSFQTTTSGLSLTSPSLISPSNGSTGVSTSPTLNWSSVSGASSYRLQVSTSSSFSTTFYDNSGITGNTKQLSGLSINTKYYWRVNASNSNVTSSWSSVYSFTAQSVSPPPASSNYTIYNAEKSNLKGDVHLKNKSGSIGSKVLYFLNSSSTAKISININKAGLYYLWGRMLFESSGKPRNSLYIQIDNGPKLVLGDDDGSAYDKWHWEGKKSSKLDLGNLTAGTHTLTIFGREIGTGTVLLDQIFITSDASLKASDNPGGGSGNTSNGNIVINTESCNLQGDVHLKAKSGSVGSKVLYFLNSSSTAKITINFPKSGQWYAWGRMLFESSGKSRNSLYIQIDNGKKLVFGDDNKSVYDTWHWEGNRSAKLNLGNLSAGNHTITIYGREIGSGTVLLDRVLFTSDPNFTASDNMQDSNNDDNIVTGLENISLKGDVHLKTKSGSVGSKVLYFLNSSSTAKITINFPKSGQWYAWGRMLFESSGSPRNSIYIQIDNGPKEILGDDASRMFDKWHWEGDKSSRLNLGNISAGNHSITIYGREIGTGTVLLDQLLFTADASLTPNDDMINLFKINLNKTGSEDENKNSVNNDVTNKPTIYELSQNYPNPFNPTTSIQYSIISNQFVSLKVYDILGNVVSILVDENKTAGTYEVKFDASDLASGIYFYNLVTNGFVTTKKMILLK